jgi:hypothetical protein
VIGQYVDTSAPASVRRWELLPFVLSGYRMNALTELSIVDERVDGLR